MSAPRACSTAATVVARLLADRGDLLVVPASAHPPTMSMRPATTTANFYLWGAMGSAALIGLGLAQAQPNRPVAVITGDGEQLMGLGGLATIAVASPRNLSIVVLDNGHFGETGMQPAIPASGSISPRSPVPRVSPRLREFAIWPASMPCARHSTSGRTARASMLSRSPPRARRARCRREMQCT